MERTRRASAQPGRKSLPVRRKFSFRVGREPAPLTSRACTGCSVALHALLRRLPADLEENDDVKILKSVA